MNCCAAYPNQFRPIPLILILQRASIFFRALGRSGNKRRSRNLASLPIGHAPLSLLCHLPPPAAKFGAGHPRRSAELEINPRSSFIRLTPSISQ
jgi:hypothetical protein